MCASTMRKVYLVAAHFGRLRYQRYASSSPRPMILIGALFGESGDGGEIAAESFDLAARSSNVQVRPLLDA